MKNLQEMRKLSVTLSIVLLLFLVGSGVCAAQVLESSPNLVRAIPEQPTSDKSTSTSFGSDKKNINNYAVNDFRFIVLPDLLKKYIVLKIENEGSVSPQANRANNWDLSGALTRPLTNEPELLPPGFEIKSEVVTMYVPVYFRTGESFIDLNYEGNHFRFIVFFNKIRGMLSDSSCVVSKIQIGGSSSPEGDEELNVGLSQDRAQSMRLYLMSETGLPLSSVEIVNEGINWALLRKLIESSLDMPYRDQILSIIDSYPYDTATRKLKMQSYQGGRPWSWMNENIFMQLRSASIISVTIKSIVKTDSVRVLPAVEPPVMLLVEANRILLRNMVMASNVPLKDSVLMVLDSQTDPVRRDSMLRSINGGESYNYMRDVFFTEFFSPDVPMSAENINQLKLFVEASDMENKERVLAILNSSVSPLAYKNAFIALDEGHTYNLIKEGVLNMLLTEARAVEIAMPVGGTNFAFQASPRAN